MSDPVIVNTSVYSVGGYDSADFDFTLTGSVTAGNVLLVEMHTNGNNPVNFAISDDQTGPTNTYDHKGHSYLDPVGIGYWTCVVANGGTVALHVQKFGQTSIVGLVVHEVGGVDTARVTDGLPVFATGTGNNPLVVMNETSVPNDLLIGSYCSIETITLNTPETGWSADQTFTFAGMHGASEKRFPAAWGTFTAGWPAITNASARRWMIGAIALIGIPITPTIQGFDTLEPRDGGNLTVYGVFFEASQGASGSLTVGGVTAAVTSWSSTAITVVVRLGANPYGVSLGVQVNTNASGSSNIAHLTQVRPASGWDYLVMSDPYPDLDRRVRAAPEPAAADQMNWETVGDLVVLEDDGSGWVTPAVAGFRVRFWSAGVGWGAIARQSFDSAEEFEPVLPVWPSTLPTPRIEILSGERRALSQLPAGAEAARARSLDYYGTLQATWIFTRAELAIFKSYGETDLTQWTAWTSIPLPGRTGTTPYKPVRFVGKPQEKGMGWNADGPITQITAQLEQRGRSVL